ncbi:MAG: DUF262 domain-containing HNH endonuclease family protein [Candidatus Poribacteria bacterium]|nr:DUF262 domain-containing HNH endonuclease family protein [Candidatus Poribacteria bacterium]
MTVSNDKNTAISTKQIIFSHLFYEGRFAVPWHQRHYDWTKEHVRELLQDIDEAIKEKRRCYFLGAIILIEKGTKFWEINDGQQRMVTLSLICACLSRLFYETNQQIYENHALRVLFDLDVNSTARLPDADELEPRLTPPRDDRTRYNLMIRGSSIGTNGKLTDAWQEIDQFVSGMGIEQSKRFMDFLLNKIEVACLHIPDDIDPNSVFETINCRGKRLEDLDLIRNYLYSYFNAPEEKPRRDTVHDNLENVRVQLRSDTKAGEYARCYFQCEYGFLPKQSFYRKTREMIRSTTDPQHPSDYVYDLVSKFSLKERVALFETIANPSTTNAFAENFQKHSNSNKKKRNLSIFLQELKAYKVAQPIVFALLNRYVMEPDSVKKRRLAKRVHADLNRITSFILRTALVVPKFEPSQFESEFSNLAKRIMSANNLYDVDIMCFLEEFDVTYGIINDDKFIEKMKVVEIRNVRDRRAKRFLLSINHSMQSDGRLINEQHCSLEHIIPRSEYHWSGWNNFEEHNPEDWIYRIGNLTLLGIEDNRPSQGDNISFSRKKEIFERSAIKLTRELDYEDWSPHAITSRQEKLAKLAAKTVWTF